MIKHNRPDFRTSINYNGSFFAFVYYQVIVLTELTPFVQRSHITKDKITQLWGQTELYVQRKPCCTQSIIFLH